MTTPKEINFDDEKYTLLLKVENEFLDLDKFKDLAQVNRLQSKVEFHITILGFKYGGVIKNLLDGFGNTERENSIYQLKSLIFNTDWSFELKDEFYSISKKYPKETRKSLIQMIWLPSIEKFYQNLNSILETNFEMPPTHITLYVGGTNPETSKIGIGINSKSEFKLLNPERI
jgi:hypothetical protein